MGDSSDKSKELVRRGEVLLLQGQEPEFIHYLHSGTLEILSAPEEYNGLDAEIIVSKSKRVGVIKEKSLVSGLSILFTEPYKKSIRALEDSYITKYRIKDGGFRAIAQDDMSLSLNILGHLCKRLEISLSDASKYTKIYQNIIRINDNLSIIHKELSLRNAADKLQDRSEALHRTFVENGGDFPARFDAKFLIADNRSILKKNYNFPGLPLDALVDVKLIGFIKRFFRINSRTLESVMTEDAEIAIFMFESLSDSLIKVLDRIEAIYNEIEEELDQLFAGEGSWSSYLVDERGLSDWQNTGRLSGDFLKNFLSLAVKINAYYQEISGKSLIEAYPGFKKLHKFFLEQRDAKKVPEEGAETPAESRTASRGGNVLPLYKNSLQQIFEFALSDKEFQSNFLKLINDFRTMKNPFDTETEGRKVRRLITRFYWELYGQVFVRSKSHASIPAPARLMLNFGFLDDSLMDETQIEELHELSLKREEKGRLPVFEEEEFLERIYNGEINPSISEMGLTYEAFLREEGKNKKGGAAIAGADEHINKVLYEVQHRIATTVSVCSGSTATAFPILTNMTMKASPANFHVSKKRLESTVEELRNIDFSAFYRETVVKLGDAREIIQEEVIPNFILLPALGSKTMLWQELDGTNRKSRGRIVVPVFFMGDLTRSIAHTIACFRYELNRSIKGGMWRDPVEGGLTGIYLDYVQFYKKNSKLSIEAKEKVAEKFKAIRDDRNRFADDYILWVLYEKDGIPKLNTVVRDIFYKNIPFRKEIRSKLETMPAFSEIANRFKNVHNRTTTTYERKFKKYENEEGKLPEKLQKFKDFLNA